jgi:ketosteroid isomerase-like protein
MLVAGAASSQDFKSQAAGATASWDAALNAGDASKLAPLYAKNAIIMTASGQQVSGPEGAQNLFGGFIKGGVKAHKITVEGAAMEGSLGYAYGSWQAESSGKPVGGQFTLVFEKDGSAWPIVLHTWTRKP